MNDPSKLYLLLLFPAFALIAAIEALWIQRVRKKAYDWKAGSASLGVAIGQNLSGILTAGAFSGLYLWVWQHHLFDIPLRTGWAIFALFLGVEFFYYCHHRASHECRWFWASHSVHHSPTQFNLSASYRLAWTAGISGAPLFYLPLIYLGFPPPAVFGMLALNLAYQFWLHSELLPKLGWFEWAFNTPSHHRVHHGTNPQYLDRNYGGVLIVFDRLFGTYAEEIEPCRYGLVKPLRSNNPFVIAFHEWVNIARDLRESSDWRDSLRFLFGRPGWNPNGNALTTAAALRAQAAHARSDQPITENSYGLPPHPLPAAVLGRFGRRFERSGAHPESRHPDRNRLIGVVRALRRRRSEP